jgi:hypothetical protein
LPLKVMCLEIALVALAAIALICLTHHVGKTDHGVQGCAEFMAHLGQELALA